MIDNGYNEIGQRVATLEANHENISETLREVVRELKSIVITLAQRTAMEKIIFAVLGGAFTLAGWLVEHILHK